MTADVKGYDIRLSPLTLRSTCLSNRRADFSHGRHKYWRLGGDGNTRILTETSQCSSWAELETIKHMD